MRLRITNTWSYKLLASGVGLPWVTPCQGLKLFGSYFEHAAAWAKEAEEHPDSVAWSQLGIVATNICWQDKSNGTVATMATVTTTNENVSSTMVIMKEAAIFYFPISAAKARGPTLADFGTWPQFGIEPLDIQLSSSSWWIPHNQGPLVHGRPSRQVDCCVAVARWIGFQPSQNLAAGSLDRQEVHLEMLLGVGWAWGRWLYIIWCFCQTSWKNLW